MNNTELVKAIAKKTDKTIAESREFLTALTDIVKTNVNKDECIYIYRFGKFYCTKRKGYTGVNPSTGKPCEIKSANYIRFKPSKSLKNLS